MKTINSIEDLVKADLPTMVLLDINKRISDWLSSGGTMEDPYIRQQFRYAENVLNSKRSNTNEIS